MDAQEKSAHAAANGEYLVVVEQLGKSIYRSLIFDSMLAEGDDGTIYYHNTNTDQFEAINKQQEEQSRTKEIQPIFH